MRAALLILLISLGGFACSNENQPPDNLIDEDIYINLLIELQLLKSYQTQNFSNSATLDSLKQRIFEKYEINKKRFQRSHQFYQNNIEKQTQRIDDAIERLRKDRISSQDSSNTDSASV